MPIRDGNEALKVNWLSVRVTRNNNTLYQNDFITSLALNKHTVETIAQAARSRWRIENETLNVMKTRGYSAEHNFGHGQFEFADSLSQLKLIAFHIGSDLMCQIWYQARLYWVARYHFFEILRALARARYFDDWQTLLNSILGRYDPPA